MAQFGTIFKFELKYYLKNQSMIFFLNYLKLILWNIGVLTILHKE